MQPSLKVRAAAEIEQRRRGRGATGGRSAYDWYADSCPCGIEPGECHEHPRARKAQRPPKDTWSSWFVLAGRGFGKTRTGAEWVRSEVETKGARRVALVAPTSADAREVMVEGESGLLAVCPPWNRPRYEPSKRRLTWPNGAIATTYSADEPERLRGPQHDRAWVDEIGSWRRPQAWSNLRLGLRIGTFPRVCITGTPRPTDLVKAILASPKTVKTSGSTYENRRHLAGEFFEEIAAVYEGTRLGRQELHAELLEALEGVWFHNFDPARHVTFEAERIPGLPVRLAIDCGTSRHTGAVFFQVNQVERYRHRVNVFADYYAEGLFSEANALAIQAKVIELNVGPIERVRLDPASTARTGVGPAAYGEYERVFGARATAFWPTHLVADGLDQIELLLSESPKPSDLVIHPRCQHTIDAFNGYTRAERRGEYMSYPKDPNHPHEELMDSLRGGIRDALPEGRKPQPNYRRTHGKNVF